MINAAAVEKVTPVEIDLEMIGKMLENDTLKKRLVRETFGWDYSQYKRAIEGERKLTFVEGMTIAKILGCDPLQLCKES